MSLARVKTAEAYGKFTTWLKLLNTKGYFGAYGSGDSAEWAAKLQPLHTEVVSSWPMLWGVIPKSVINEVVEQYTDRFPFIDTGRTLRSTPFIQAMLLADEAQVALRGTANANHGVMCPTCLQLRARIATLEQELRSVGKEVPPVVPDEETLLNWMWQLYEQHFLHGVGMTPRDVVRDKMIDLMATEMHLDISKQHAIFNSFVCERLLDDKQRDAKFIHCCPRLQPI